MAIDPTASSRWTGTRGFSWAVSKAAGRRDEPGIRGRIVVNLPITDSCQGWLRLALTEGRTRSSRRRSDPERGISPRHASLNAVACQRIEKV